MSTPFPASQPQPQPQPQPGLPPTAPLGQQLQSLQIPPQLLAANPQLASLPPQQRQALVAQYMQRMQAAAAAGQLQQHQSQQAQQAAFFQQHQQAQQAQQQAQQQQQQGGQGQQMSPTNNRMIPGMPGMAGMQGMQMGGGAGMGVGMGMLPNLMHPGLQRAPGSSAGRVPQPGTPLSATAGAHGSPPSATSAAHFSPVHPRTPIGGPQTAGPPGSSTPGHGQPQMLREQFAALQAAHAGVGGGVGVPPGGLMASAAGSSAAAAAGPGAAGTSGFQTTMQGMFPRPTSSGLARPGLPNPLINTSVSAGSGLPVGVTAAQAHPVPGYAAAGIVTPAGAMPAIPPTGLPPGMSMMYNPGAAAAQAGMARAAGLPGATGPGGVGAGAGAGVGVGVGGGQEQQQQQAHAGPGMQPVMHGMPSGMGMMSSGPGVMRRPRAPTGPGAGPPMPGTGQQQPLTPQQQLQQQQIQLGRTLPLHPFQPAPRSEQTNPHQRVTLLPPVPSLPGSDPPQPDYTYGGSLPSLSEGEKRHLREWMERDAAWADALRDPERQARERAERADLGMPRSWWMREGGEPPLSALLPPAPQGGKQGLGFEILWPGERRRREAMREQQKEREREREARNLSHALPFSSGSGSGTPISASRSSRKQDPPFPDKLSTAAANAAVLAAGSATVWSLPPQQAREMYAVLAQRKEYKPSKEMLREAGGRGEVLVPVRLEVEHEHWRLRDTFVWNVNDPIMTPDLFAQTICDDFHLPSKDFFPLIKESVLKQLQEVSVAAFSLEAEDPVLAGADAAVIDLTTGEPVLGAVGGDGRGRLGEREKGWWEGWKRRLRAKIGVKGRYAPRGDVEDAPEDDREARRKRGAGIGDGTEGDAVDVAPSMELVPFKHPPPEEDIEIEEAKPVEELEREIRWSNVDHELRVLIKLDITYGFMNLTDQFEWDINNTSVTPEQWAESYAADLGLAPEFKTAIAHDIREQVHVMRKSLIISDHTFGGPVLDAELRSAFLPPVSPLSLTRNADEAMQYTPILSHLTEAEIAREEAEREKEARRRKRQTRGRRGVQQLPDREPLKTHRSIPLVGSMAPREQVPVMPILTSRRAAAAAATASITKELPQPEPIERAGPAPPALVGPPLSLPPRRSARKAAEEAAAAADGNASAPETTTAQKAPVERARPVTKKQLREKEREAKEMEYMDTQKENIINGVWHCSNCGCPESVAIGRRKGPLGEKTMCGACGKYWHRYRRPREVEYNTSEEYHRRLREAEEAAKRGTKYRKKPITMASIEADTPDVEMLEGPQPDDEVKEEMEPTPAVQSPEPPPPVETTEVEEPAPKASHPSPAFADMPFGESSDDEPIEPVPKTPTKPTSGKPASGSGADSAVAKPGSPSKPKISVKPSVPKPKWLVEAYDALMAKYPNDKIDLVPKLSNGAPTEWKIKCLDCPGKLYNTGPPKQGAPPPEPGKNPEETLSGFEVHLKNRNHRRSVDARLSGKPRPTSVAP